MIDLTKETIEKITKEAIRKETIKALDRIEGNEIYLKEKAKPQTLLEKRYWDDELGLVYKEKDVKEALKELLDYYEDITSKTANAMIRIKAKEIFGEEMLK